MRLPYEERFWSRVRKTNRCWLWTAGRGRERLRLLQAVAYKRREVGAPDRLRVASRPHPRRDEAPPHLSEPAVRESCAPPSSHTVGERLGEQSSCEAVVQSTGLSERARPHAREPSSTAAVRPCVASANTLRNGATTSGRSVLVLLLRRLFLRKALATAGTCRSGFPEIRHGSAPDREHHQIAV